MDFVDLIIAVHDHLDEAAIGHAFGGALALGYVATPRGTVDIDVNCFVPIAEIDRVTAALRPLGYELAPGTGEPPIAGHRLVHDTDPFPIDVFCDLDERYDQVAARVVEHRFGRDERRLPFLSAEDLTVFKLSFGRPQDWVDLAAIVGARSDLDLDYVEEQAMALRGPTMLSRVARLRSLAGR